LKKQLDETTSELDNLIDKQKIVEGQLALAKVQAASTSKQLFAMRWKLKVYEARGGNSVPAPIGNVTLVFTDIQNSTQMWESTPEVMCEALVIHNSKCNQTIASFCLFSTISPYKPSCVQQWRNATDTR
jgi:hypothetical protein